MRLGRSALFVLADVGPCRHQAGKVAGRVAITQRYAPRSSPGYLVEAA
jgi:hypothetical protein